MLFNHTALTMIQCIVAIRCRVEVLMSGHALAIYLIVLNRPYLNSLELQYLVQMTSKSFEK